MALIKTQKITFGGKELELRLDGKAIVDIEKKIRKSIFTLFFVQGQQNIPTTGEMLLLIHGCITTSNVSQADMFDLLDNYMIEEGKGPMDLMMLCMEILEEGGFFGRTKKEDSNQNTESLLIGEVEAPEEADEEANQFTN